MTSQIEHDQSQQYLTFMLGEETFAVNILAIKEIIEFGRLTEVPMMPQYLRGVINLRGRVVPVIDLQSRFGKPPADAGRRTCIIILESLAEDQQDMGVMVDAVNEVIEIPASDMEPPPSFGTGMNTDFIHSMAKANDRLLIVLEVERILACTDRTLPSDLETPDREQEPALAEG